ncbi:hypothetical protein B0H17DRAFT_1001168 [Mycena rosella]|uniref:F-box domain-containing protein n=1 Tax=Mycena rosella TaxID=1033263 RepID=A0AAD7GWH4_MYCRO|nr:hypothetical protein B0H17DRAFT_1001168 [Mycena rosella]
MPASHCSQCGAPITSSAENPRDSSTNVQVVPKTLARHLQLMSTNAPPETIELAFIRTVAEKTRVRLADLENQMVGLRERVQQLEDEHILLSRYHAQNQAIISPLRRMPPEVLGDIFSWTLPSVRDALERLRFDMSHSPWVLAQVCSRWRAVALSTPSLWSLVVIDYRGKRANPLSMVKKQIERAQSLKIRFYGREKGHPRAQFEMFQLLAEHSPRWEEVFIELTSDTVPLLASVRNLPSLRRLGIQWNVSDSQAGVESMDCFQAAPSLLDVSVYNEFSSISIPLPAHQLTRYDLDGPWEVHQTILKLAVNLVEAHIYVVFNDLPWPDSDEINLLLLRRLFISHSEILEYLMAPAIQELAYAVREDEGPDPLLLHLEAFVERSGCRLRRLCLVGKPTADTAVGILRRILSVSELGIITDDPNHGQDAPVNVLVSHLTVSPGSAALAPQLSKIYFGCRAEGCIDYALYLQMLQSRWDAGGRTLKAAALLVDSGPHPDPATLRGLGALRQEGLDFLVLMGEEAADELRCWIYDSSR